MHLTAKEIRLRNLLLLIERSGMSKGALALKIETSPAYISQILSTKSKRSMGDFVARNIEIAFNMPKGWMDSLHSPDEPWPEPDSTLVNPLGDANWGITLFPPPDSFVCEADDNAQNYLNEVAEHELTPFILDLSVTCGLQFAKSFLLNKGIQPEMAFSLTLLGNSMEPVLPEGSLVGVDSAITHIKDGDIYAINHAGGLRVKMIYRLPGGGLRLRSFNSEEWPDEYHSGVAAEQIKVLGRVFWWSVWR